ncbi:helix-turn-helix domain-containing protein [Paenibacillus hodogayensis]|uniref:Helix-turn-helix domain-containing protein n=1 Tax=Paenibacillus hodogayensis TaxID=279208 RepID=A0ABV5VQR7_9BACL
MKREKALAAADGYDALRHLWFRLRDIVSIGPDSPLVGLHYATAHLLLIAVDREAHIVADGHMTALKPGGAFVCLPRQLVQVTMQATLRESGQNGEEHGLWAVRFDAIEEGQLAAPALEETRSQDRRHLFPLHGGFVLSDPGWMQAALSGIRQFREAGTGLGALRAQTAFHEALCRLLEDAALSAQPAQDSHAEEAMDRALDYMERHLDQSVTIDELARQAGLSRYHYMRSFKQKHGISAMDYLTGLRINKAKQLMDGSPGRLREIARQVGYSDEYYFIRKFKQQVGIPPATFIKKRQRKVAAYSFPNIGQLLALQIVPIAAPMDHSWTDAYRKKYETDVQTKLSHDYAFNREALRLAPPDCIIGVDHFVPAEEQEKLRQIAPALFVPWLDADWRQHLRVTSGFLGIVEEAESWLDQYDRTAAVARERVSGIVKDDKVLVLHMVRDHCYAYGARSVAGVLYEDLRLAPPSGIAGTDSHKRLDFSGLAELDADRLLLMFPGATDAQAQWEALRQTEPWRKLKAVRNNRVSLLPLFPWFEYSAHTQQQFLSEALSVFHA